MHTYYFKGARSIAQLKKGVDVNYRRNADVQKYDNSGEQVHLNSEPR